MQSELVFQSGVADNQMLQVSSLERDLSFVLWTTGDPDCHSSG